MKHYMDKFEHGGFFYATARRGQDADQLLDFSVNINPLGLSESVRQAVRGALEEIIYYPDAAAVLLKEAIAERYQVDSVGILAGNGAAELLYVLCHVLRPKTVVIPAPTFSEYERAALSAGASIHYVPLCTENGFSLPVGNILKIIPEADLVFLCNPNNPTGRLELKSDLEIIVAQANKHNTLVVLDESFVDFVADAEKVTCKPLLAKYSNLVIVQSLTKIYAIPGLRLGFMLADRGLVERLERGKDPWNVNTLAQAAGVAALKDVNYLHETVKVVTAARESLEKELAKLKGLIVYPGSANFLLLNLAGSLYKADRLGQALAERHILIRNCANYPGLSSDYVRIAVKKEEHNREFVAALATLL